MKVGIVGIRGYTGLELARVLTQHPGVQQIFGFSSSSTELKIWEDASPELEHFAFNASIRPQTLFMHPLQNFDLLLPELDLVFLATPAETSLELVPKILAAHKKVIDLSGAFRVDAHEFDQYYQLTRQPAAASAYSQAHYGLVPWNSQINHSVSLIANPGCYATAVLMALLPLLKNELIDLQSLVIDAKSGATGAGKKAQEHLLLSELAEECLPYKVGQHQHLPEIKKYVRHFTDRSIDPHFTTHILPVRRGISAALYATVSDSALHGAQQSDASNFQQALSARVTKAFTSAYENYPLIRFSASPQNALLSLKKVTGTARTHICFQLIGKKLYVFSTIDNLLKGAASQAVENLNLLYGLPITTGLIRF